MMSFQLSLPQRCLSYLAKPNGLSSNSSFGRKLSHMLCQVFVNSSQASSNVMVQLLAHDQIILNGFFLENQKSKYNLFTYSEMNLISGKQRQIQSCIKLDPSSIFIWKVF